MRSSGNRYLEDNFAPVREELTVTDLEVTGHLPPELDGRFLRNGPNPVIEPDPATYHWFTGTGMVHGVRIADGQAHWYRNRYVRSADTARALGEEPRPGPVHAGFDFSPNTHVIGHAGLTLALVEAGPRPYALTDELDTIGPCDFDGTLPGGYTAHPLRDPDTGELHAVSYYWAWGNRVQYSVLDPTGHIRKTVDIEVTGSPMMHAFSLTENHVVILDLPVVFDLNKAAAALPRAAGGPMRAVANRLGDRARRLPGPLASLANRRAAIGPLPYSWDPEYPARVGVMPREGDAADVTWFDVEPCYVYHPLNAYDDGQTIVLDVVRHPKMFATDHLGPNEGNPTLDRWTVDLEAGKVLEARLDDHPQEFPRLDERLIGRRHRYGYGAGFAADDAGDVTPNDCILKHDVVAGTTETHRFGPGQAVGEFVFVPAGPAAEEDEGTLLGLVYDAERDRSDVVVLDAQTLGEAARVHLPVRVPHGFHGSWVPTATG